MWTVTTLVDRKEKPILKPVSAYDIDKYFGMLVDMYKEDAVLMTMVDYTTRKVRDLKVANRMDLNADDTIRLADKCLKYEEDMASLTTAVKGQLRVKLDLADWELNNAIRDALEEVKKLRQVNDDDTQHRFARFVNNYVDGSYADQLTDEGRLANLIARRIENVKAFKESFLANLDDKAAHCAQMLKLAYPDKIVDVKKAQEAIASTLRTMIERAYPEQDLGGAKRSSCKTNLDKLMVNGRLFTDELRYDISLSRARPGRNRADRQDENLAGVHQELRRDHARDGVRRGIRGLSVLAACRGGIPGLVHAVRVLRRSHCGTPRRGARRDSGRSRPGQSLPGCASFRPLRLHAGLIPVICTGD